MRREGGKEGRREAGWQSEKIRTPYEDMGNYLKTDFLMAVISGQIPLWKLMRNCLVREAFTLARIH